MEPQYITKPEAVAALIAAASTVTDEASSDHGRTLIHCMMSFTGANWDLGDALALVEKSEQVAWTDNPFRHDLAVLADGRVHRFDVKRPAAVEHRAEES